MRFEWDADNAQNNRRKHQVSFEVAARVSLDPKRIETYDDRENYGEDRWKTVGLVEDQWLAAVYTLRGNHEETIRIISARRAMKAKKERIVNFELDPNNPSPLTVEQQAELDALTKQPDASINYADIPKITGTEEWRLAIHSPFHKPVKQQLTARIDADVLAWLKSKGRGYQSRMNAILRNAMFDELRRKQ